MGIATCPFGLIVILCRGPHSAATQLRVFPSCEPSSLRSASVTWVDFLGANSCAPITSHFPWGVYLPFSRIIHVVLPWSWPSHGLYLSQGLPAVVWILHESGLPPTETRTYGLGATFLCYCSESLRPDAFLGRCSFLRRCLTLGDVSCGQPVDFLSLGPLRGPTMC